MKLNNKGFLITGILYSLLLLFLILIVGMVAILSARQNKLEYISRDIITKLNDKYDFNIARSWSFDYTGDYQVFTVPTDGYYNVELWGAQGGSMTDNSKTYNGGAGAYTKGTIYLTRGENIYIYVGGRGSNNVSLTSCEKDGELGGYNGGGTLLDGQCIYGSSGGGATDIRLNSGTWDDFNGLKSRIMVAAGGGGANFRNQGYGEGNGGAGGAYVGESGVSTNHTNGVGYSISTGATQTAGGMMVFYPGTGITSKDPLIGKFGGTNIGEQSGGGSGYYGSANIFHGGAGGGSSFVSGLYGCDAITGESTENDIVHTGQPNHYSGKIFSNGIMIAGNDSMPNHDGTGTMVGNTGNGYAKISLLSSSPKSYTMTNLVQNGSFEDGTDKWIVGTNAKIESSTEYKYYGNNSIMSSPVNVSHNENFFLQSYNNSDRALIDIKEGNKYYCQVKYFSPNSNIQIVIYAPDWQSTEGLFVVTSPKSSTWKTSSLYIDKKTSSNPQMYIRLDNDNNGIDTPSYFDGYICVNLTESFGAGNEPSKEWCDENISYFDGTSTIYK